MRRKSRHQASSEHVDSVGNQTRPFCRHLKWLVLLATLGVTIVFTPAIVTRPAVLNKILSCTKPEFIGCISCNRASAGWLTPIHLQDVTVLDLQDQPLLEIEEILTEHGLWGLLTNRSHLGQITLQQPRLLMTLGLNGTNLDPLWDNLVASANAKSSVTSSPTGIAINIVDGQVKCQDLVQLASFRIADLDLLVDFSGTESRATTIDFTAVTVTAADVGRANMSFQWQPTEAQLTKVTGKGNLRVDLEEFPLGLMEPILRHLGTDLQANGSVSGTLKGLWDTGSEGPVGHLKGELEVANLVCTSTTYLKSDQLRAERTKLQIAAELANHKLNVRGLEVKSDFGYAKVTGTLPLVALQNENGAHAWERLAQIESLQSTGMIALVKLSQTLPTTLHLREGTQLTDGHITWELTSEGEAESTNVRAIVQTAQLSGVRDGQSLSWTIPIQVSLVGAVSSQGLQIRELRGESGFVHLSGAGTPSDGNIVLNANLRELRNQVGQIFELGGYQLDGILETKIAWQQDSTGALQGNTNLTVTQLEVVSPHTIPWREDLLEISATAQGMFQDDKIQCIDLARVELKTQNDQLDIDLLEPIIHSQDDPQAKLSIHLHGDASSWIHRLGPWLPVTSWTVQGNVDAQATATVSTRLVSGNHLKVVINNFRAQGPRGSLIEPVVKIEGQANWDQTRSRLQVPWLTFASSTMAFRAEPLELSFSETFTAGSKLAFRGDLLGLWQLVQQPNVETFHRPGGQLEGQLQFAIDQDVVQFSGSSTVENLVYEVRAPGRNPISIMTIAGRPAWAPSWREPVIKLTSTGTYNLGQEQLNLKNLLLESESISFQVQGQIAKAISKPHADLGGQLHYDLALAANKMKGHTGDTIQISGRQSQSFSIHGPLTVSSVRVLPVTNNLIIPSYLPTTQTVSNDLTADLSVGWDALKFCGIEIGPSQISARLSQGAITTIPINVNVSGGRLLMSPRLELNSSPKRLMLNGQARADNIEITPEMSRAWLQYIAPWVAGAAVAEGRLSIQLDRADLPIGDPAKGTVQGTVTIHQARVQPGPLTQQLIQITQQISQLLQIKGGLATRLHQDDVWLEVSENRAAFAMAEGRVYHENLVFHIGEVTVQSSGWVGLDKTIRLVTSIPLEDDWVERRPVLSGLRDQTLQIPISGTISHPQLDLTAMTKISSQLLGDTAQGLLNNEIQKGLQKLFGN